MTDDEDRLDASVPDAAVHEMVSDLRPGWRVRSIDRVPEGTDLVAVLDVATADDSPDRQGTRRVVLKATAADLVPPPVARAEPRLLDLVDRETEVPVPSVLGYRDAHPEHPAPFYLLEYVTGETLEGDPYALSPEARERVVRDAGANLAALHEIGTLPATGQVGVGDGDLTVLDTDEHPRYEDFHQWLLGGVEENLDALGEGGFFPDLADEPERFADLVDPLRAHLRRAIEALPAPEPPRYCHRDYRLGNLLLDPDTGETRAVLDWANLLATDPVYNLADAETMLLDDRDDPRTRRRLREALRSGYERGREGWTLTDGDRRRLETYRLTCRVANMCCLPLWYPDREERERQAERHREAVAEYV